MYNCIERSKKSLPSTTLFACLFFNAKWCWVDPFLFFSASYFVQAIIQAIIVTMAIDDAEYIKTLKERGEESRVYKKFQLTGLEIAKILEDKAHTSLYIKFAKQYDNMRLMMLAKDIAERKNVKNKGAYFMKLLAEERQQYGKHHNNR